MKTEKTDIQLMFENIMYGNSIHTKFISVLIEQMKNKFRSEGVLDSEIERIMEDFRKEMFEKYEHKHKIEDLTK